MKKLLLIVLFLSGCAGFQAQDVNSAFECVQISNVCYTNLKTAVELEDPGEVLDAVNDCLQTYIDSSCEELVTKAKETIENAQTKSD